MSQHWTKEAYLKIQIRSTFPFQYHKHYLPFFMQRSMLSVKVILRSKIKSKSILEVNAFLRPSRAACLVFALLEGK